MTLIFEGLASELATSEIFIGKKRSTGKVHKKSALKPRKRKRNKRHDNKEDEEDNDGDVMNALPSLGDDI